MSFGSLYYKTKKECYKRNAFLVNLINCPVKTNINYNFESCMKISDGIIILIEINTPMKYLLKSILTKSINYCVKPIFFININKLTKNQSNIA